MGSSTASTEHAALRSPRAARASAAIAALVLALVAQSPSLAAGAAPAPRSALPAVQTGGAKQVGYGSATLTGAINPNGSDTSYYFQYGPTKAYGGQTAIADVGAGKKMTNVSVAVTGLQPLTGYHYRLIAVNSAGAGNGADKTFMTTKVPLSLAVLASPNPVIYGAAAVVQGTLSGTGSASSEVVLQANPFPYTAGFVNVGNPELTMADGSFSFPVLGLAVSTQFRVMTATKSVVVSPVATETVAPRIETHVARTRRSHHVRIYGTVAPAENGMHVGIVRVVHGRNVLVAGTVLRHHTATSSSFSVVVRVRPGVYKVLVRITSGAQVSAYGQPLQIR